ncbi:MAG: TetR/AcrR family transcriptional regulator [Desulfobacterales bacterium]
MTTPDPEDRSAKIQRILEAAVRVFARQGFHQSTVAQVAREAGVADGTIYNYFRNKDDILIQFFAVRAGQVFARFRSEVARAANGLEKLRLLIRAHLAEFQRDPDMAVVYETETHQSSRLAEEQIRAMAKTYQDILAEIIEQGQEEGLFRRDLYAGLVKRLILGAVQETISSWLRSGRPYDLVSMADPLVDLFLHGIAQSPPAAENRASRTPQTEEG